MNPINKDVIERIKREEGSISHMYLDTRGYVTVGVGHMMPNADAALKLPFTHRSDGGEATEEEIINEYNELKRQEPGLLAQRYSSFTKLELSDDAIEMLLKEQIGEFTEHLKRGLPDYEQYPEQAQQALLDMAFNLGVNGLLRKFPKLIAYVEQGDWQGCSLECRRNGIGDDRNAMTRELFSNAAKQMLA